jgi:serine protease Do
MGDWLIALGDPLGLTPTVSVGILSARARQGDRGRVEAFLQTDAAINPGNAGGPLLDSRGTVVGINTTAAGPVGGIGFAVPIDVAKQVLPRLRAHGRVRRGWLGVGIQELTSELAAGLGVPAGAGVLVSQVYAHSPAARAGLAAGDVVVALDDQPVADGRVLTRLIGELPPGARVRIRVRRAGDLRTFKVRLAERGPPAPPARAPAGTGGRADRLGLELAPLTDQRAERMGSAPGARGLVVVGVDPDGPTASILAVGDLILEVNRVAVVDLGGLRAALSAESGQVLLRVQRGEAQVYVVVKAPRPGSGSAAR